jgi:hypothetical protein
VFEVFGSRFLKRLIIVVSCWVKAAIIRTCQSVDRHPGWFAELARLSSRLRAVYTPFTSKPEVTGF